MPVVVGVGGVRSGVTHGVEADIGRAVPVAVGRDAPGGERRPQKPCEASVPPVGLGTSTGLLT